MKKSFYISIALLAAAISPASAEETVTRSMSFEACLDTIRSVAAQLAVAPVNIVETNDMRMVRFVTNDGSVLVTCSRPDRKMVLVKKP